MALVLIGFMGAGKSTLAGRLAQRCGAHALDSDALLAERFGHSVAREFELHGEAAFRAAEEEVVCGLLAGAGPRAVIALGGGSVLSRAMRDALAGHLIALLDVDVQLAWERVHEATTTAPSARWRATATRSRRSTPSVASCTSELADAVLLWAERRLRRLPGARRPRAAGLQATSAGYPRCLAAGPLALAALLRQRRDRRGALYAERLGEAPRPGGLDRDRAGRGAQDARERRARVARARSPRG